MNQSLRVLAALALLASPGLAEVELSPLFSEGAVLQRDQPIRVWGRAEPGEGVDVRLSTGPLFLESRTVADGDGRWELTLDRCGWGGPLELRAGDQVREVWLGEVWICSGQSNMEWPLAWAGDPQSEIAAASNVRLRLFKVPRHIADEPQAELTDGTDIEGKPLAVGGWQACTPETARMFSAVGYHFGRELEGELNVPIGLIHCSWGGTRAEAWTTPARFESDPALAPSLARELAGQNAHSVLYNGMLAPIERLSVAGVIWYQGEANANEAGPYRTLFPAMIESWREALGSEELPFLFVQLAAFMERRTEPTESAWAELREAQALALELPATGMAVAIDIGDAADIHPKNKREVGRRLALLALRDVYDQERTAEGPTFAGMSVEGDQVRVSFEHADGLTASDGIVRGFAVAAEDGRFFWAEGRIDGEAVVLRSPRVERPVHVRYGWADNPAATLVNGAGLPAVPFRTDSVLAETR